MSEVTALPLAALRREIEHLDLADVPSFAALFEAAVALTPDAVAVSDDRTTLTYRQLDRRSAALSAALAADPAAADDPVAALTRHDVNAIVAFLGVIRSGRPLVMLDRVIPQARLTQILELSGARLVLTDSEDEALAGAVAEGRAQVSVLDGAEAPTAVALPPLDPDRLAALLFTSGSTGQPKGVMWSQRLLAADGLTTASRMGYGVAERVAMTMPVSFAAGMVVVTTALVSGAHLHMADPRELGASTVIQQMTLVGATVLHGTPSMLRGLLRAVRPDEPLRAIRIVSACGEALHAADIELARRVLGPEAVFVQWFGSSEGGSLAFLRFAADVPLPESAVPVGYANTWRTLRVLDDAGRPSPTGEPGELVVTSSLLASGYWNDPERTAERMRRRPDGLWDLHTGDVAALDESGCLRLLGRSEAAVKIGGYLVDPSEIEANLLSGADVAEAVVVATDDGGTTRLVAYFVPTPGERTPSGAELRARLLVRLPTWMVPTHVVPLSQLPRNERGKVDRQALPPVPAAHHEPPTTATERALASIWAEVLAVPKVGRTDDFFQLGGDSLAAEEMLARADDEIGAALQASDLTQAPSLAGLAARIDGDRASLAPTRWPGTSVEVRRGGSGRSVFCIAGADSTAVVFAPLASLLQSDDSVWAFVGRGVERRAPAEWSIAAMARRRVAEIRHIQPTGPYTVVGHSFGAILAMEVAQLLTRDGEKVIPVLLDPMFNSISSSVPSPQGAVDLLVDRTYWRTPGVGGSLRWMGKVAVKLALLPLAGLLPPEFDKRHMLYFRHAALVAHWHRLQPWDGWALAYRTAENTDAPELWSSLLPQADVEDLPCAHTSMLRSPYIETITKGIESALRRA